MNYRPFQTVEREPAADRPQEKTAETGARDIGALLFGRSTWELWGYRN